MGTLRRTPLILTLVGTLAAWAGACDAAMEPETIECDRSRAPTWKLGDGERECWRDADECSDGSGREVRCGRDEGGAWGCDCNVRRPSETGFDETTTETRFAVEGGPAAFCDATGDEQEQMIAAGCGWAIRYRVELCRCDDLHADCIPCTAADERCLTADTYVACDVAKGCATTEDCGSSEYYCAYSDGRPVCDHCDAIGGSECSSDADCDSAGCANGATCESREMRTCGYCPAVWDHCLYATYGACVCR